MKPVILQELKNYTLIEINKLLGFEDEKCKVIIRELQDKRILKLTKDGRYSFRFVGMILCFNKLFFCIPKYVVHSDPVHIMKQLLTLFREYSKREKLEQDELESFGDLESMTTYNLLSLIIFLLNDYGENGLYQNDKSVYILNGDNGEIDWDKTINDEYAIINRGKPIYLDYYVNSVIYDENDYFRLLHMYVLTNCSTILEKSGLRGYLGFPPLQFDVDEGAFESKELILSKINSELSRQYIHRKQRVLKAVAAFISHYLMIEETGAIEFYGTRNFEIVWEKICSFILHNQYDYVKDYIAKPTWKPIIGKGHETDTLRPDVISIFRGNGHNYFLISDAKYYNIELSETNVRDIPGVGDVTKQYLYQLAFKKYIENQDLDIVHNVLIFPSEKEQIECLGKVTIEFLKALDLKDIIIMKLPTQIVFNMYIKYKRIDLGLFVTYLNGFYIH